MDLIPIALWRCVAFWTVVWQVRNRKKPVPEKVLQKSKLLSPLLT